MPADSLSFLIFRPEENGQISDRSTEIWVGEQPVPGIHMPASALALVWNIVDGDTDPNHYLRVNLSLIHHP